MISLKDDTESTEEESTDDTDDPDPDPIKVKNEGDLFGAILDDKYYTTYRTDAIPNDMADSLNYKKDQEAKKKAEEKKKEEQKKAEEQAAQEQRQKEEAKRQEEENALQEQRQKEEEAKKQEEKKAQEAQKQEEAKKQSTTEIITEENKEETPQEKSPINKEETSTNNSSQTSKEKSQENKSQANNKESFDKANKEFSELLKKAIEVDKDKKDKKAEISKKDIQKSLAQIQKDNNLSMEDSKKLLEENKKKLQTLEIADEIKPVALGASSKETSSGSNSVTYPVILKCITEQTLRDKEGNTLELVPGAMPNGLEAWWEIEVDTSALTTDLDFYNLYITVFGSGKQGLNNGTFKIATTKSDLDITSGYLSVSGSNQELMTGKTIIAKNNLDPKGKLYIRVKMPLKPNEYHSKYSMGLRINPDKDYVKKIYDQFLQQYNSIPTFLKFIKGSVEANKYVNTPFNLVEDMFVADFGDFSDPQMEEHFYYDNTRTIVATYNREAYTTRNWWALDLLRMGESEDTNMLYPSMTPSPQLSPTTAYYVPNMEGGYTRRPNASFALMPDKSFIPGTIVTYDYKTQSGSKSTKYTFKNTIASKPKNNADIINKVPSPTMQGGKVDLFSRRLSPEEINGRYYSYLETPYPIMRINSTFEMAQCFNYARTSPAYNGSYQKVDLTRIENPTGNLLYRNLNDINYDFGRPNEIFDKLQPGGIYNPNMISKEAATEDLFKRVYFFAEEIKEEYKDEKNSNAQTD